MSAAPEGSDTRAVDAQSEEQWAYSVGVQNYVFGLPLTIFERERSLRLDPAALEKAKKFAPAAPINQIGHMKTLATADDVMPYTPNNDTVYSGALLELGDEPIILTAPDIADRYWSVEVADSYTNNLFYIGTRATNGKGGNHAFVGPNWKGTLPPGVVEHRVPTNSVMFAIRIGVLPDNAADLAEVNALQEQFSLTSLSNWGDPAKHGQAAVPDLGPRPHYDGDLAFFQTVADLLTENPPPPGNEAAVEVLSRAGSRRQADGHQRAQRTDASRTGAGRRRRSADHEVEGEVPRHAVPDPVEQPAARDLRRRLLRPRSRCTGRAVRPRPRRGRVLQHIRRRRRGAAGRRHTTTCCISTPTRSRPLCRTGSGQSPCTGPIFSS